MGEWVDVVHAIFRNRQHKANVKKQKDAEHPASSYSTVDYANLGGKESGR